MLRRNDPQALFVEEKPTYIYIIGCNINGNILAERRVCCSLLNDRDLRLWSSEI
jgi:hypothetical protein